MERYGERKKAMVSSVGYVVKHIGKCFVVMRMISQLYLYKSLLR